MSNRKETPDVLGEILGGAPAATPAATSTPTVKPITSTKAKATKTNRANGAKSTTRKATKKQPIWAYMAVRFRDYRGWRPRFVDGQELSDWKNGPLIEEYLNQVGQVGWEMVGIVGNGRSERDAYFKRAAE